MRHSKTFRKFNRESSHRKAMLRNLATSLLQHERIETTIQKAKELRRVVEPIITKSANDTLHSRRSAYAYIYNKDVVQKLFSEIAPRYKERNGGYTRIIRTSRRPGDTAEMAIIELVDSPMVEAMLAEKPKVEAEEAKS